MKTLLFILVALVVAFGASGQDYVNPVTNPAQFKGGDTALYKHLSEHTYYPYANREARLEEIVYATVILDAEGHIHNLFIRSGITQAAIDAVVSSVNKTKGMWNPAKQSGDPVPSAVNIPIMFTLDEYDGNPYDSSIFAREAFPGITSFRTIDVFEIRYNVVAVSVSNVGPGSYNSNYTPGSLTITRKDDGKEEKWHEKMENEFPRGADANYIEGVKAYQNGQYQKAKDHFDLAYRGDPTNHNILFSRGMSKMKMGKINTACKDWTKAVKHGSKKAEEMMKEHCKE